MAVNDEQMKQYMLSCGLGRAMWKGTLPKCGEAGVALRKYVLSRKLHNDIKNGCVLTFIGDEPKDIQLFWAFMKEFALLRRYSLHYLSIRQLTNVLRYDTDSLYDHLISCDLLVFRELYKVNINGEASGFEYSAYEQGLIEDFFNMRKEGGKSLCFNTPVSYNKVTWWSKKMLHDFQARAVVLHGR